MPEEVSKRKFLKRNLLRDEIREAIQEAIDSNELNPGDRIIETQWAKDLGVSKAPVREAIRELEAMGILENQPYQGAYVRSPSSKDIVDASKVRQSLEAMGMREAAKIIQDSELEEILTILHEMEAAAQDSDFELYIDRDMQFHRRVMEIANNGILLRVWEQSRIAQWTKVVTKMSKQSLEALAIRHEAIYQALAAHDPERAEMAAVMHLDELLKEIKEH